MRKMVGLAGVVFVAVLVSGDPVATRQFRGGTALVLVDVVATQRDGNLARDLKREDFEIFEDGKPQQVRQFQVVDLEVAAQQAADPPGVFSNRSEPGGIFALVLDEMMVDARHGGRMQDWARRFIDEQVRPGDYVGVMRSGTDSPLLLTTDRDLLRPVIAAANGRRDINDLKSLTGTDISGDTISPPGGDTTQMPDFSALGLLDASPAARIAAEQSMVMLQRVVEYLAPIPARRKAVLLFSQGVAFDLEAFSNNSNSRSFEGMRRLLTAAREGNVAVYTLDPRGLQGAQEPDIQEKAVGNPIDRGVDTLRDLAAATGGRAIVSRNDLAGAFERISRENRFYYLIGYEPADTNPRSRAKRIEVRTRAPGVSLLHRRTYSPPAANAAKNAPAMVSPLPVSDLAITLAPVVFPDPTGGASLAVPFELGAGLAGTPRVNFRLVAIDGRGRQSGLMTGTVQATSGSAKGMVRQQLAPGRYQLRLQADIPGGASGVALANVEMIAPNAAAPTCGGFMLLQADFNGPPRPNVSRRLRANQSVMAAIVLSARDLANTALALVARRTGAADAEIPVGKPQSIGTGLWRVETGIPASTFTGDVELTLLANEQPVPNCRAEVRFE